MKASVSPNSPHQVPEKSGTSPTLQLKAKTHISNHSGGADLYDEGSTAKLYNLEVEKHKRGRGEGTALVQEAISTARAQGKSKITLDSERKALDPWYKKQGFKAAGKTGRMTAFEMDLTGATVQRKTKTANPEISSPPTEHRTLSTGASGEGMASSSVASGEGRNQTGLPDGLKAKMEGAFGTRLDHIRVNTNSSFPAKVGAIATTQGHRIDFAPGQYNPHSAQGQKLIGHEAWHTVQQAQGRVKPTLQMKTGHLVNDSEKLEAEADRMGERVVQRNANAINSWDFDVANSKNIIQRAMSQAEYDKQYGSRVQVEDQTRYDFSVSDYSTQNQSTVAIAKVNGWYSSKYMSGDHEHAEDSIIRHVQELVDNGSKTLMEKGKLNYLSIHINKSPCTSTQRTDPDTNLKLPATSSKGLGCTEELIELQTKGYKGHHFQIRIKVGNLYQPNGVGAGAKKASIMAIQAMTSKGIMILGWNREAAMKKGASYKSKRGQEYETAGLHEQGYSIDQKESERLASQWKSVSAAAGKDGVYKWGDYKK